jgi:hypothetical protein
MTSVPESSDLPLPDWPRDIDGAELQAAEVEAMQQKTSNLLAQRLRTSAEAFDAGVHAKTMHSAADTIERLTSEIERLRGVVSHQDAFIVEKVRPFVAYILKQTCDRWHCQEIRELAKGLGLPEEALRE